MAERAHEHQFPVENIPIPEEAGKTPEMVFEEYFPGKIETLDRSSVPPKAMVFFEERSRIFALNDEEYTPENFDKYYSIHRDDAVVIYIASQHREGLWAKQPSHKTRVHFYETLGEESTGYGSIEFEKNQLKDWTQEEYAYSQKPFVVIMHTPDGPTPSNNSQTDFTRQGYGKKRLVTMGAYSLATFGEQLYSGDANTLGVALFDSLVEDGLAEEIKMGTGPRRRFKMALKPLSADEHS